MITCLNDLVPVRPRRQITYPLDALKGNAPSQRVLKEEEIYCLNHINRKLTLEPKVDNRYPLYIYIPLECKRFIMQGLTFLNVYDQYVPCGPHP